MELHEHLTSLQGQEGYLDTVQDAQLRNEFLNLLEEDDLRWQQRAKVNWMKGGDKNMKSYHACANQRRKVNNFDSIKDEIGRL